MSFDLRAAERQNHLDAYISLAKSRDGEVRQFGPITAISTGIPHPEFNRVFVFESPAHDDFTTAMEWVESRNVPFWLTTTESTSQLIEDLATDHNFRKINQTHPGMVLESLAEIPSQDSDVDIIEVTDSTGLEDFISVFSTVFDVPGEYLRPDPSNATDDNARTAFVGYLDDRPVATGSLFRSDSVAGVFAIAVVEDARNRGIGEAITWGVLRAGRDAGCRIGALQSSEIAIPLYEKMGFETVETYHYFESNTE